jgi:pantetheine-phosphate adenylyltransferase
MTKRRVALYPGTFDPPTLGHMDIIERALKLTDHLVVGVAANPGKSPLFSHDERVAMMRYEVGRLAGGDRGTAEVQAFDHLLIDFAKKAGAGMIIRGLRAVSDFEYEFQMVGMNQRLNPEIEIVFLMADPRLQPIASRLVKEIALLGGDVSTFTTPHVADLLKKRCQGMKK